MRARGLKLHPQPGIEGARRSSRPMRARGLKLHKAVGRESIPGRTPRGRVD